MCVLEAASSSDFFGQRRPLRLAGKYFYLCERKCRGHEKQPRQEDGKESQETFHRLLLEFMRGVGTYAHYVLEQDLLVG